MAVHAAGGGHGLLPAVGTLHLVRLVKVFEISAADQATGWGRGHVVAIGWEREKGSGGEYHDNEEGSGSLVQLMSVSFFRYESTLSLTLTHTGSLRFIKVFICFLVVYSLSASYISS